MKIRRYVLKLFSAIKKVRYSFEKYTIEMLGFIWLSNNYLIFAQTNQKITQIIDRKKRLHKNALAIYESLRLETFKYK